ncbi:MAG: transcriptional repressor [Bacteroides sp.]|nr:transcriptional repressor [Roseburia sp.]MCM1347172.1 transcriptional repressor [Bacteroides sp.]MCM1421164.1 transcriptional repressor [Bacteroides sp.]
MDIEKKLEEKGIRPTANRILVMRALHSFSHSFSLREMEDKIDTLDKSSVFRTLRLFADHHLIHEIDDGSGSLKYELCMAEHTPDNDDLHTHFFCEKCGRTICLHDIPVPRVRLPDGFVAESVNYVIKGICDECNGR